MDRGCKNLQVRGSTGVKITPVVELMFCPPFVIDSWFILVFQTVTDECLQNLRAYYCHCTVDRRNTMWYHIHVEVFCSAILLLDTSCPNTEELFVGYGAVFNEPELDSILFFVTEFFRCISWRGVLLKNLCVSEDVARNIFVFLKIEGNIHGKCCDEARANIEQTFNIRL